MSKKAIIIGAGPAGLTAAYELLKRTDILPIILEKSGEIGGISRTIDYKGNRMDMGPHRFFSKSDRVMDWWLKMIPLEDDSPENTTISYQNKSRDIRAENADKSGDAAKRTNEAKPEDRLKDPDKVMLVIQRLTRIYFLRKFFAYPIQLSIDTLRTLGLIRTIKIMFSFLWIRLFPRKPENSLEDFIINKFGRQLYLLFFKDYTEKVWGVPCNEISAEWGAQRIKGVSLSKAILEALKTMRNKKKGKTDIGQKGAETSLIEQFLYPKKGPGSLWEEVARQVQEMGGKIFFHQDVQKIHQEGGFITTVNTVNSQTGMIGAWEGDYFFSTMPVKELIAGMEDPVPSSVREVAEGLQYRDFINVGILLKELSGPGKNPGEYEKLELKDNWIYIQERDVKVGRLMIYNNWGGGMIKDPTTTWIGMEYFCNKTDTLWELDDETIQGMAIMELEKMGLARVEDVLDATVRKMEKTYPAYFGTYDRFSEIREFTDTFENLFLVGRNGMHKYNNADHSMLCAMVAVDNIEAGVLTKDNLWAINTEQEYHEEKLTHESDTANNSHILTKQKIKHFLRLNNILINPNWKITVLLCSLIFCVQFIIFKSYYPFANYMPDSYSYLQAAFYNLDVNTWPVGYSKFLRLVSVFTHSDKVLVGLQYAFLQLSSLILIFNLSKLLTPSRWVINLLLVSIIATPIPLFVSNYISADSLFISFSMLWISSILWLIKKPTYLLVFSQAILLYFCFILRYSSLYYPLITALVFVISRMNWIYRLASIALTCFALIAPITFTSHKMEEISGEWQFSPFGGWQIANNALYMYEHVESKNRIKVPQKFNLLETMVKQHLDTLAKVKLTAGDSISNFFYLWSDRGPLVQYMRRQYRNDTVSSQMKKWASEGPLYGSYARFLIEHYPLQYTKYFVYPNALKYIFPPSEFLGVYNMGGDSVGDLAKAWFNYKSTKISSIQKKRTTVALSRFGAQLETTLTMFALLSVFSMLFFPIHKQFNKVISKMMITLIFLIFTTAAFSAIVAPIVLRYLIFSNFICFAVGLIILDKLINSYKNRETNFEMKTSLQ